MAIDITNEFIFNDAYFNALSRISLKYETIMEFITNYIQLQTNKCLLLSNISNLYVLVAKKSSYSGSNVEGKLWDNFLNTDQLNYLNENGEYILGYILLGEKLEGYQVVDYIDTRLRGCNLAEFMMKKYNKINRVEVIPGEIIDSSLNYWKRYLGVEYTCDVDSLLHYIFYWINDDYNLKWDNLLASCDEHPDDR